MEEKIDAIFQRIANIEGGFVSFQEYIVNRDEIIRGRDARIAELTDKLLTVSKEKDDALWAKIELLKEVTAEREQNAQQMALLKAEMAKNENKIEKLREKSREAQDGLIGSSFEMDRIKKEVEEKEKQIQEIEEKVSSVKSGLTGILTDVHGSVDYFRQRILSANRSLRLVVPTFDFMEKNGLVEAIDELPDSCVVNIALALDKSAQQQIIDKWKSRGWYINNYQGKNFLMVSANGADVCIAFYNDDQVSGFYSNIDELVTIFNQALMYPYIKGQKL